MAIVVRRIILFWISIKELKKTFMSKLDNETDMPLMRIYVWIVATLSIGYDGSRRP
jgi:hypothetical protein